MRCATCCDRLRLPSSTWLFGVGTATAASGGAAVSTGAGGGEMMGSGVVLASTSAPLCSIKWSLEYTLYPPNGPINWSWRSTIGCTGTKALALSTRANLYRGSLLAGATPTVACQNCASATSHGFKSIADNGAGSVPEDRRCHHGAQHRHGTRQGHHRLVLLQWARKLRGGRHQRGAVRHNVRCCCRALTAGSLLVGSDGGLLAFGDPAF